MRPKREMRGLQPLICRYPLFPHGGAVHADGIVSSSVVGYSGQDVKAGQFYMVAVQFADVGAIADVANFNNFFSTTCAPGEYGSDGASMRNSAPMIEVLQSNGLGYDFYYYISDAIDSDGNLIDGACWADDGGYIVTDADLQALSKGFWFKAFNDGTITCAGQVSNTAEFKNSPTASQFNIVANPYPIALELNSVESTNFTPGEYGSDGASMRSSAPIIEVLQSNGLGYDFYYYISDAIDSDGNLIDGACWADDGGYIATGAQVPVGQSFWVKSASAGTFTFAK